MSNIKIALLWKLTALVAVILALATFALALKSQAGVDDVAVYIDGPRRTVYLRTQPSYESRIVTILQRGTPALIKNTRAVGETDWYLITTENENGWLPAENISLEAP